MTVALTGERPGAQELARAMGQAVGDERITNAVSAHYGALRRAMRRLGVTGADLDDVLQEVFLVFTRKISGVAPHAERSFLLQVGFRIVQCRQRDYVRRREEFDEPIDHTVPAPSTPEDDMTQRERIALLDRLLGEMPIELRAVLVLCDIEEATLEQAAAILETKAGTVSSRLFRAREVFDKLASRARAAQEGRFR